MGARSPDIRRLVLREGVSLAAAGAALGVAGSLLASRWLGALVYGISPRDPFSYGMALVLLPAGALLGCWRPAAPAGRADAAALIREQ
jgi:ABC-type antimicrobial peptide transport system permease subunit